MDIGLDAHALPWTRILNNPQAENELADMVIVAGYPGGSPDIPQSMQILAGSVEPIRQAGVEIVDSIDALLDRVDVVLVLSIDGRKHLSQARQVIAAGKPLFVDKPMAASVDEAREIFRLAAEKGVPCFSSSALRFSPGTVAACSDSATGQIQGCDAFSPCPLEPHHPDLFWYGIHGVETLFTIMGGGCESVQRVSSENFDVVVGRWQNGRLGTFRGTRQGAHTYGASIFGNKEIVQAGKFEGYEPLLVEIVKCFKTGRVPVSPEQTLEILAFMQAADESKRLGGRPVRVADFLKPQ
ncbi:MAG: Gfo/Idh/MocA family oxidoreductase [Planctomycetes bacterium]|nr:Gfo/Idh/MocA family oxidoreductase [Planctomycetota bacterium]